MSVRVQLSFIEWLRVLLVSIQSQYEGGTLLNNPNPRMALYWFSLTLSLMVIPLTPVTTTCCG